MWSETYTIGHNEGMRRRPALAVVLAASACEASLGGGGDDGMRDASVVDTRPIDAPTDMSIDARPCMGGDSAAVAPDGSCLVHVTSSVTFQQARAACTAMTAHLAYLKTAQLDTFAQSFVGNVDTWIGGDDLAMEGDFRWGDGTAFVYTAWATGEPNNGGDGYQEDCVIIAGARAGKLWDDRPCDPSEVPSSGSFAYLCQY
jgi:hypothetical protein